MNEENIPADLGEYLKQAESWNDEAYRKIKASRTRAWLLAGICLVLAILSVLAVLLLVPLKRVDVVPVLVNENTGEVQVLQSLNEQVITANEAITEANLVQYVIARETYDRNDIERLYKKVALFSGPSALKPYTAQFNADGDENPLVRYGNDFTRTVKVKSVSRLNANTGQVRFYTTLEGPRGERRDDWIATIRYEYVNTPTRLIDRVENPLGFVVTSYRADQEIIDK